MLDVRRGRVAYAVLSSGGFLGIGDKLLAIPWSALTLDTDSKCFRLAATAEQVRNSPGFDKDSWPSMVGSAVGELRASALRTRAVLVDGDDVSKPARYRRGGVDAPEAGGVKL